MSEGTPPSSVNVQPIAYPRAEAALRTPWNGLAIASLVLSVIALGLLGVILGHIALHQIKRTGEQGWILAVIGVVLGYLGIVAAIVFGIVSIVLLSSGIPVWTNYQ